MRFSPANAWVTPTDQALYVRACSLHQDLLLLRHPYAIHVLHHFQRDGDAEKVNNVLILNSVYPSFLAKCTYFAVDGFAEQASHIG